MKALNPVFAGAGTTIFTIMSALANQHGAVNLGQGFPDIDGPLALRERAAKALIEGPNQYPPMMGVEVLRQALSAHAKRHYDLNYDWRSEIVVTSGATEALTASIMGLVKAGDEVILIEPAYDSYRPIVETIGGIAKPVRIGPPHWAITEQKLAQAFSPRTKAIVLNSPMNPAGKVFSADELRMIASFVRKFDALAISDEVYEHLTFDGLAHVPFSTLEGMYERTVRIGSAGKIFSLTGWKVGWVEGPAALIGAVAKAHQYLTFTTAPALQIAVAEGLNNHQQFYADLAREFEGNRNHLAKGLRAMGFETLPAQGTYFLTTDIAKLRFNGNDVDFCKHMTEHARVAAIPLSVFYTGEEPQTLVRFAFCKRREVLDEALRRLASHFPRN